MNVAPRLVSVLVVDCGGFDVLGIAWRDLAYVAGTPITAADGPAHIAPGVVSLHDAYRFLDTVPDRVRTLQSLLTFDKAIAIKGYKLPAVPVEYAPWRPVITWRFLPHDGWPMIAVADDGRTFVNWRAMARRLDGYTGPRPKKIGDEFDGAPFADTVDLRDVVATLQQHAGQHWKIPQVLAALSPLLEKKK